MKKQLYTYKEKSYYVESFCTMKNNHTREWDSAVIYIAVETGNHYCREASEFFTKFLEI